MKKFSVILAILSVSAAAERLSKRELSVLSVGEGCLAQVIDKAKFKKALAAGMNQDQALVNSGTVVRFDKRKYDMFKGKVSNASEKEAIDFATEFKYSNNSAFCRQLRTRIKTEQAKALTE